MTQTTKVLPSRDDFICLPAVKMAALVRQNISVNMLLRDRLKVIVMLGWPRTGINAVICYMLGVSFAGHDKTSSWVIALGAVLYFVWASLLANLENHYADLQEDCHNVPGRVYLVAQVGYRNIFWYIVFLHVLLLLAAIPLGFPSFLFMLLALLVPHQYSFLPLRAKARSLWCPIIMAQLVVFPLVAGIIIGQPHVLNFFDTSLPHDFDWKRALGMIVFVNLWFFAKGMFKNVPDFAGDKAAGLSTSATICGSRRNAAIVTTIAVIIAYGSLAALVILGLEERHLLLALLWTVPILWNCLCLIQTEDLVRNNRCCEFDSLSGAGFMASVLLLIFPTVVNIVAVAMVIVIVIGCEYWHLDARGR
jgi:4-hydroxybenzoate polyprenyltransferase